jgi:hypothetical protein
MSEPINYEARAAVLREGAAAIVAENDRMLWASKPGKHWAADLLVRMAETSDAVAAVGALPMPVGPEPRTLDVVEEELTGANLALYEEELENARLRLALESARRGRRELRARVAELEAERLPDGRERVELRGRYERVLSSFSVAPEAAAEAVMAVRDHEVRWLLRDAQRLQDQVTELKAERHSTNEALDDAVQELRRRESPAPYTPGPEVHAQMRRFGMRHCSNAKNGACQNCGSLPESWCPDCAACERGCFGGFDGNPCTHSNARWGKSSRPVSLEDPHDGPLARKWGTPHDRQDMYETGGAS